MGTVALEVAAVSKLLVIGHDLPALLDGPLVGAHHPMHAPVNLDEVELAIDLLKLLDEKPHLR